MRCKAKNTTNGEQCKNHAVKGMEVCRKHGGASLKGIASPSYKTGRYSKYLPGRLLDRYHEAAQDPELLNMREEIALLDARLSDLLTRVDTGEAGKAWKDAQAAQRQVAIAVKTGNTDKLLTGLDELESALGAGVGDYQAWNEIQSILDQRRKLTESERKRLVDMQQIVTTEQAMLLIGALLDSVRRNVSDRNALAAIQADFVRLMSVKPKVEVLEG